MIKLLRELRQSWVEFLLFAWSVMLFVIAIGLLVYVLEK